MAESIVRGIIEKIQPDASGMAYEEAVRTGTLYWLCILENRDPTEAKKAHDAALSAFLGCSAHVDGRKRTLKERLLRRL